MTRTAYTDVAVAVRGLTKSYGTGQAARTVLDGVDVAFPRGSFTAVMGPSGSGKSTLLQCAAGLDRPDAGSVTVAGTELTTLDDTELTHFRRDRLGFVFQAYNLMPTLTVRENVTLPAELAGRRIEVGAVREVLGRLGLGDHLDATPAQLSGGQQQRVAIARTLLTRPEVVFADEPTGALDTRSAAQVLTLLREIARADGRTIVMVTHDPLAASTADAVLFFADGSVVDTLVGPHPEAVAMRMANFAAKAGAR